MDSNAPLMSLAYVYVSSDYEAAKRDERAAQLAAIKCCEVRLEVAKQIGRVKKHVAIFVSKPDRIYVEFQCPSHLARRYESRELERAYLVELAVELTWIGFSPCIFKVNGRSGLVLRVFRSEKSLNDYKAHKCIPPRIRV